MQQGEWRVAMAGLQVPRREPLHAWVELMPNRSVLFQDYIDDRFTVTIPGDCGARRLRRRRRSIRVHGAVRGFLLGADAEQRRQEPDSRGAGCRGVRPGRRAGATCAA